MAQSHLRTNRRDRRGAGAVEYGLVIALVAAGALVAVSQTGGSIAGLLSGAAGKLNTINSTVQPAEAGPLYAFSSHTFTTCGRSGRTGPTLSQCRSAYGSASWAQNNAFFDQGTHQGFQLWTVPETGTYRITAEGAAGGDASGGRRGGHGARMRGDFQLTRGDRLTIVVGQLGQTDTSDNGGGGGGTFVWEGARGSTPLIAAGGGGGGGEADTNGRDGVTGQNGTYGNGCSQNPGTNGQGGTQYYGYTGAGAGWLSDGAGSSYGGDSDAFLGGNYSNHDGGFGGGGSGGSHDQGGGGGGGYSGGGSGCDSGNGHGGGGGGSYNAGSNPSASSGVNGGHGRVQIQYLGG